MYVVLEPLNRDALRRICEIEELPLGGSASALRARIADYYAGDIEGLLDTLRAMDLKEVLRQPFSSMIGEYTFSGISNAVEVELRDLACLVFVQNWQPTRDGEQPLGRGSAIAACSFQGTAEEYGYAYDEDDIEYVRRNGAEFDPANTLDSFLGYLSSDTLAQMLKAAGLRFGGGKPECVARLRAAVLNGQADFTAHVLAVAPRSHLIDICEHLDTHPVSGWHDLRNFIIQWFESVTDTVGRNDDHGRWNAPDACEEYEDWSEDCYEDARTYGSWDDYEAVDGEELASFQFDPAEAAKPPHCYQREVVQALADRTNPPIPNRRLLVRIATGGGKTRVANDWLWNHAVAAGRRTLWVTKDWELLRQASSDLCRRYEDAGRVVGRVGGQEHLPLLPEDRNAMIVYSTIHTWVARQDSDFRGSRFDHVVIDEVHWGEGRSSYARLDRRYRNMATFIGLTATPRAWSDYEPVCHGLDFPDLVRMGILARPHPPVVIQTGERWRPERSGQHGDFNATSLSALAQSPRRNRLVIDTYCADRERFGKTLVFACNVDHAMRLAALFVNAGIPAAALHYEMTQQERRVVINQFRTERSHGRSRIDVLVNVAMMTHGVDIPDIQTIFLARPTASDTLFSQMVGRGARRTERKDAFWIVDFVDNLDTHGDALITSGRYFGEEVFVEHQPTAAVEREARPRRHDYRPAEIIYYPGKPGYEALQGIEYQPEQTFGIEFELTRDDFTPHQRPADWVQVAEALRNDLSTIAPTARSVRHDRGAEDKDDSVWNVIWDGSCGWEITSRVLQGEAGLEEVFNVCSALTRAAERQRLKVNYRTGTHVHLGWRADHRRLLQLMELVSYFEPALMSLVSPSRASNAYCEPIRKHLDTFRTFTGINDWREHFERDGARYLSVNPSSLFQRQTLEIRLHNGTHEAPKILAWMSLWMRIIFAVEHFDDIPAGVTGVDHFPLCTGPHGDVTALARLLRAGPDLTRMLTVRRAAVMTGSWMNHEDFGALARHVYESWNAR